MKCLSNFEISNNTKMSVQTINQEKLNIDFSALVSSEMKSLRQMAMQLTHNPDDSDDLVQETILKALRYKNHFEEGTNLKGWLYTILKNSFINNYRRNIKRNTFLDSTDNLFYVDTPSVKLENQAELKFIRKDLDLAINKLPEDLKITFTQNMLGFKYHEIAEELGIPIGTVKTRIFVARRILRKHLQAYGEAYGLSSKNA
jgi:RNA polymerase sigma factor (sigma-70 family)